MTVDPPRYATRKTFWRRYAARPSAVAGLLVLVALVVVAVVPGLFVGPGPNAADFTATLAPPGGAHPLGTDALGRDLLSRLVHGTTITIGAAAIAVGVAVVLGVPLGLLAGYAGGRTDAVLRSFFDGLMSVPGILVVVATTATLGTGLVKAMVAIGVVIAPRLFRVQRATTISTRQETYIEACESMGCGPGRILWLHVLPNSVSPLFVQVSIMLGAAVVIQSSLDFIGIGVQPPQASWGTLLADGYQYLSQSPFMVVPAGLAITVTVIAFALVGEGLKVAIDGRAAGR